jgi:Ion channel
MHLGALRIIEKSNIGRIQCTSNQIKLSPIDSIESSYSFLSLQSRESSVDLKPNKSLYSVLYHKRKYIGTLTAKLKIIDIIICIFGLSGLFAGILQGEIDNKLYLVDVLCICLSVTTGFMAVLLVVSSYLNFLIKREKKIGAAEECNDKYLLSKRFKRALIEILVYSIHPLPFINYDFEFKQLNGTLCVSLREISTSLMVFRVFILLRLLQHYSKWTSEHSSAICDSYGAKSTIFYSLKALLREKPIQMIMPLMGISLLSMSFALRTYEKNFRSDNNTQDYSYIWNSMWLVMLTMTTVGYGDFYPKTHAGRFIASISAAWGIFLVSLAILSLTNMAILSKGQTKSYAFLKKIELKNKGKMFAAIYVKSVIEILTLYKKRKKHPGDSLIKAKTFYKKFKDFQKMTYLNQKTPEEVLRGINENLGLEINRIQEILDISKDFNEQLGTLIFSQDKTIKMLKDSIASMRLGMKYVIRQDSKIENA